MYLVITTRVIGLHVPVLVFTSIILAQYFPPLSPKLFSEVKK